MGERHQSVKIRAKLSTFIGFIADYDSLADRDLFKNHLIPKIRNLCTDMNWEVRNSVCANLYKISKYMNSSDLFLDEMSELIEDEEIETAQQAFL